jgi:Na+/phosphate symporter
MPDQALKDIKKDLYLLMHKAEQMLELTEDAFMKNKVGSLDQAESLAQEIRRQEDALTEKLAKLASSDSTARAILSVPVHIEKIAVSIERVVSNVRVKIKEGLLFSDKAIQETGRMLAKGKELLKKAGESIVTASPESRETVRIDSDAMIRMSNDFATSHEDRLVAGECSPKASSNYLCMLYAFEDMASHAKDAVSKLSAK